MKNIDKIIEAGIVKSLLKEENLTKKKSSNQTSILENQLTNFYQKRIILKEQEDVNTNLPKIDRYDSEYIGFETYLSRSDSSNKNALKMLNPESSFMKKALDSAGIPEKYRIQYFIDIAHYDEFIKTGKLGKTASSLGIGELGDPYTYAKINNQKFKVISGPIDGPIGKTFAFSSKNDKIKNTATLSQKSKKSAPDQIPAAKKNVKTIFDNDFENFSYSLGNTVTNIGQKFIERDTNNKINLTYLFPTSDNAGDIMVREPGGKFKSAMLTSKLIHVIKEYEKQSGKKIKLDRVNEDDPNAREIKDNDYKIAATKKSTTHGLDRRFYAAVLKGINAPVNEENLKFMSAWGASENTVASFNPLATTLPYHKTKWSEDPGMTVYNTLNGGPGVKNYSTFEAGVNATIKTLYSGKGQYYKNIREKLIAGTYLAIEIAKHTSELAKWVGGDVSRYCYDLLAKGSPGPINAKRGLIKTVATKKVTYKPKETNKINSGKINTENIISRRKEAIPGAQNFTWDEFIQYDYQLKKRSLKNTPESDDIISNIKNLAKLCQSIRTKLAAPVNINSGYRNTKVNSAVGGVDGSYHKKGLAADIQAPKKFGNNSKKFATWIANNRVSFPSLKKILWYKNKSHVHIVVTDNGMSRTGEVEVSQYDGNEDGIEVLALNENKINSILTEKKLRKTIQKILLEQEATKDPSLENAFSDEEKAVISLLKQKAIKVYAGKIYIKKSQSLIDRYEKIMTDLESFLKKKWKWSDVSIGGHGTTRSMSESLKGGGDRQAGTKHGIGLAFDFKINVGLPEDDPTLYKKIIAQQKEDLNNKYSLGNTATINGMKGVKLLKRNKDTNKIIKTYFIPDSLDKAKILSRVPGNQFSKVDSKEVDNVALAFNKVSSKKIKNVKAKESVKLPVVQYSLARNENLAANKEFVKLMYEFSKLDINSDLTWGGTFKKKDGDIENGIPSELGIKEFHHFEYNTEAGKKVLADETNYSNIVIKALSPFIDLDINKMCDNIPGAEGGKAERGKLYKFILDNKSGIASQSVAKK